MKKTKLVILIIFSVCALCILTACSVLHEHQWEKATCTAPKTCSSCGETEGRSLGHVWMDATCENPKTCSDCGETEGRSMGHTWEKATCTNPKTCTTCNKTEGAALGHNWTDATCYAPKTCSLCNQTLGTTIDHIDNGYRQCTMCHEAIKFTGNDLKELYGNLSDSYGWEIGSDNSYLFADTNVYDLDDYSHYSILSAIKSMNESMGLPSSLYNDMLQTTWSMGKQTETLNNLGLTVSWTYHPDKGLEVTYKLMN